MYTSPDFGTPLENLLKAVYKITIYLLIFGSIVFGISKWIEARQEKNMQDRKRLAVDVPIEMHKELKMLAAKYNITITMLVLRLINEKLKREKQFE